MESIKPCDFGGIEKQTKGIREFRQAV